MMLWNYPERNTTRAGALYTGPHSPYREGQLSVQAISWVLDHSESTLGSRLVFISIANHAKKDGTGAWPSVRLIAEEAHLSEREVRYCLRSLEASGELKTTIGSGPHGCNLYSLPRMFSTGGQNLPGAVSNMGQFTTRRGATHCPRTVLNRNKTTENPRYARIP
jgi:hypothetical protein